MPDSGRVRNQSQHNQVATGDLFQFVNPYPWMSTVEALMHLELERRHVPFSWRYMDGYAPNLRQLMPDYNPEFTLSEYHLVILILGNFFTDMPGVLDKNALAAALLEQDGWHVVVVWEGDIRSKGARGVLDEQAPELNTNHIDGTPKPNPFGRPDLMAQRRAFLAGQGLHHKRFLLTDAERKNQDQRDPSRRKRGRRLRFTRGAEAPEPRRDRSRNGANRGSRRFLRNDG